MNKSELAQHFHSLTAITREDIFGATDSIVRPLNLPDDAVTMFSGYVGENYTRGRGLLLLAINPGGGGDSYTKRIPEDEEIYPILAAFKDSSPGHVEHLFDQINVCFSKVVQSWNLWRILGPTLVAAGMSIGAVAYMNVVPYRTRGDKMPPADARRVAWSRIVSPSIDVLSPRAIVTLGKKADSVVAPILQTRAKYYCVPRTIGDSRISPEALHVLEKMRQDFHDA